MREKMVGMELVGTANALRRLAFQDGWEDRYGADSPTSMQQWFLSYIWKHREEKVFQKNIEAMFKIRRSTATEILKAMERKKLIVRIPSQEDRRSKEIHLTEKAEATCRENQEKIEKTEKLIVAGMPEEEIRVLLNLLGKIQKNMKYL